MKNLKVEKSKSLKVLVLWGLWGFGLAAGVVGGNYWWNNLYQVKAAEKVITSRVDFDKGSFENTETYSKEGELKLKTGGTWGASAWMTPNQGLSNGSALVSDDRYTYIMGEWNLYFARYDSVGNKWKQLANPPYDAGAGSDMLSMGDYIYAIFGGKSKQKYFARYSKSANSWEVLPETPEKMGDGASLTTDGTSIYCTRGAWLADFWKYNTTTKVWAILMSAPATIQQGSNMVYKDGNIYLTRGYYTEMYRYNIATDGWYPLGSSPVNFYENHNIDLVGNNIYVTQDYGTTGFYKFQLPDLTIVGAIGITNGGSGYLAGALTVDNTGTGGSGLAGTYTVDVNGVINGITITSIGSSYTSMPVIIPRKAIFSIGITNAGLRYTAGAFTVDNTGTGGSGLAGTYTVGAGGAISGFTITNNGEGYNSMPTIGFRKTVYSVGITNAGLRYTAGAFTVDDTGTGGSGLAGTYTVGAGGAISGFTITNNGDGYNSAPLIIPRKAVYSVGITTAGTSYVAGAFTVDDTGTGGSGLAGTYTVNGSGGITGFTITNNGDGYNSAPVVTLRKAIYSVGITSAGSGYTAGALIVDNTGTGGSGFAGTYTVDGSGRITGFVITNNGDGYNSLPTITPQPGGSGAVLAGRKGSGGGVGSLFIKRSSGVGARIANRGDSGSKKRNRSSFSAKVI